MSIQQHKKKADAIRHLQGGQRIWAEDLGWDLYDAVSGTTTFFCPPGIKRFYCLSYDQAYDYLKGCRYGCLYEVLRVGEQCSLYFDCDMAFGVSDEDFANSAASKGWRNGNKRPLEQATARPLAQLFFTTLKKHLRAAFAEEDLPSQYLEDSSWTFSQACSPKKFSLHVGTF